MFLPSPTGPSLKIGIIRTSSIGDVILATSCLHLLARMKIPVEITWIGRDPSLTLIRKAFPSLSYVELEKRYQVQDIVSKLAELHFLLDLQANLRSRVIGRAFKKAYGKPVYVCAKSYFQRGRLVLEGRMYGRRRELPAKALQPLKLQYQMMTAALFDALKRQLPPEYYDDLGSYEAYPLLPTAHEERKPSWQKELMFGSWLAVAPGASYESKRAPLAIFVEIIRRVREKYYRKWGISAQPLGLLCLGDSHDRRVCLDLLAELGWNEPVLNLAGKVSLWETTLALAAANCLLSNDSGVGHIAEAVATPAAVLFGPTVEGFGFAPHMAQSRAFSVPLGCRPCSKHGKSPCRFGDHLCFKQIPSEEVAEHLMSLLGQKAPVFSKERHESKAKSSEEEPFSYL